MNFKSYFIFTRSERNGLFVLVVLILSLQLAYHRIDFSSTEPDSAEKRQWLALQAQIDSLQKLKPEKPKRYPFNPNFITDFKGYQLGMSVAEIDRLLAFRKLGKYVNSAEEFQQVTQVSDSLLASISPYFKFPEWIRGKGGKAQEPRFKEKSLAVIDINSATKQDLMDVYGIGDALSDRILKQREILGGFVSMSQMEDIWGLSAEVVEKLKVRFKVSSAPEVRKIRINDASVRELSQFPYFRYALSREIVTYRSMNGGIKNADELKNVKNFPLDKIGIIAVYLEF